MQVAPPDESHVWIARFADRLMQLQPDVRLSLAFARAASMYAHVKDMAPEEAAQMEAAIRSRATARGADAGEYRA